MRRPRARARARASATGRAATATQRARVRGRRARRTAAAMADGDVAVLVRCGIDEKQAKSMAAKQTAKLVEVLAEAGVADGGCDKAIGVLLHSVAGKYPANALVHRPHVINMVVDGKLKTLQQMDAAYKFLKAVGAEPLDTAALDEASGVGVVVTKEQIQAAVSKQIAANKEEIEAKRYRFVFGKLQVAVSKEHPWALGREVKEELDAQVKALLGPKTAADEAPLPKVKKEKKPKAPKADTSKGGEGEGEDNANVDLFHFLPKVTDNNQVHTENVFSTGETERYANDKATLQAHLERTGGAVVTRFPPEPNGYLHIGHAKAMHIDFGYAKKMGGRCYLRFDDTNPAAERQEYIDHIQEIVAWLGWEPYKVTYSSDYFDQLHALAVELIKADKAYVCHQTGDQISASRAAKTDSPWRNRPVEESLQLFEDMRRGLVAEGAATLRMKQDPRNVNFNMYDLIAYRIKFRPHPHAGSTWCIYPSYDFTHCLVDALEDITHSMCTLEFETRRASYYWLCHHCKTYLPHVWEYSRLNITNTVMSKRKLNQLVMDRHVDGWDDPRLLTLSGLRRRGATPDAINAFCHGVGVSRNANVIPLARLEHYIREDLNLNAPRAMAVQDPLRVVITNWDANKVDMRTAQRIPPLIAQKKGVAADTYEVPLTKVLYIERTDFKKEDVKGYYGLAPNKHAILRYAYPVLCTGFTEGAGGVVEEIQVEVVEPGSVKPKGVLHWVAQPKPGKEPLSVELRLYSSLFKSLDPQSLGGKWLDDVDHDSKQIVTCAYASPVLADAKPGDKFQFERLGYFSVDPDSSDGKLVFNRTVTLREDAAKKKL